MVEKKKSKINGGVIIAALLLALIIAQITLLSLKLLTGTDISWIATLFPAIITGGCILLAALYFVIGSMIIMHETKKQDEKRNEIN